MKRFLGIVIASLACLFLPLVQAASDDSPINPFHHIWFEQPADKWDHALPIGNGRLGAMIFGGVLQERLQLNEDTVWAGKPTDKHNKGSKQLLDRYRQALFDGNYQFVDDNIMGDFSINMEPKRSHQTLGDLLLNFDYGDGEHKITHYQRRLSLDKAISSVSYRVDGNRFLRESFVSHPHQVFAIRLSSEKKAALTFSLSLDRPRDNGVQTAKTQVLNKQGLANRLAIVGRVTQVGGIDPDNGAGVQFYGLVQVELEGGQLLQKENSLQIIDANSVVIYFAANTDFYGQNPKNKSHQELAQAAKLGWQQLKNAHIADHQSLYQRSNLMLPLSKDSQLPTDKRLAKIKQGESDSAFSALYYHYGRYLLISSSRVGTQPANLQGLWNQHIRAPWNADYHVNINLQMNYWPADLANLSELQMPLFGFIERLAARGEKRARENFGARGWVSPHASDIWASAWTRANKTRWGLSHVSNAWLMSHMVDSYRFSLDEQFLSDTVYPQLKAVCLFYFDWLVAHPDNGKLVSGPAASPENSFLVMEDGKQVKRAATMGPAMDQQIIAQLFKNTLAISEQLGIADQFTAELKHKYQQLSPGIRIAEDGRIMEWFYPYEEAEPGHRHISHLYALYPGTEIHPLITPDYADAAKKTIDYRLAHGGAATGWSRAWMINFMARLYDGDAAKYNLDKLYQKSTSINLFDYHPPFQIDGNFGATAAIVEMLLQSHMGFIDILPALPSAWSQGELHGVKARGGFEIDILWHEGEMAVATITPSKSTIARVRYQGRAIKVIDEQDQLIPITKADFGIVEFPIEQGSTYQIMLREPQL